jgi:Replication factor A protein 3
MSEEVKAVHREPHPFVGMQHLSQFVGRTVAFVGKVSRVEDGTLLMRTNDGKFKISQL